MKNEKPWTIGSWEELRQAVEEMKPRSKLYEIIKSNMKKRGHWRAAPRGLYVKPPKKG